MKTFIVASLLAAFALVTSAQAGDNVDKAKAVATSSQTKTASVSSASCGEKSGCCAEKSSCCAEKVVKKTDVSVKGATLLVRR